MGKIYKSIYYLSLFLVGLPSVYLLTPTINTANIAKVLWVFTFAVLFFENKLTAVFQKHKTLSVLFLIFLIAQSLSVLNAQNIPAFLNKYKDAVFVFIFFIASLGTINTQKEIKNVVGVLFATTAVNFLLQLMMLINPQLFIQISSQLLHPNYFDLVAANIERGRLFLTNYDEAIIPLVLYFWVFKQKNLKKNLFGVGAIILVFAFAALSGFRTKILMLVFSTLATMVIFKKSIKKTLSATAASLLVLLLLNTITPHLDIQTSIDRLEQTGSQIKTITTGRIDQWYQAVKMGATSPAIGVGLGNYYDNLDSTYKRSTSIIKSVGVQHQFAIEDPHNIFMVTFAETGTIGLVSFIALVIYFIKSDLKTLRGKNNQKKTFLVSFWTLFIFALLNPSISIYYQTLFWLFRMVLEKQIEEKEAQ